MLRKLKVWCLTANMACDRLFWNIFLDFLVLACVGLPLLMVQLYAEPFQRGYFENDETIRYPYVEQSISETLLALLGFALIIITVIISEIFQNKSGLGEKFLCEKLVPGWLWESYRCIGVYTFGAACQQLTVTIGKYTLGRLRPFFYEACQPVRSNSQLNNLDYIIDYTCMGTDVDRIKNARLSFPSGHSCYAMYTAIFLILYIQTKCKWRGSKLCRHLAQYAVLISAWYVGLSRVQENHHHWSDVGAGFLIGTMIAIFTFVYIYKPKTYGLPHSWQDSQHQTALPRPVLAPLGR